MLKKFDADGDGKLSVQERREAINQAKFGGSSKSEEKKNPPAPKEGKPSQLKKSEKGSKKGNKGEGKKPKGKKKDS